MISLYIGDFHISNNWGEHNLPPPPSPLVGIGLIELPNSGLHPSPVIETKIKISKIHSFFTQCCARSSFCESKVLHLSSAEEGFLKVPCFDKIKNLKHQSVRSPWKGFSKGEKVWSQILRWKIIKSSICKKIWLVENWSWFRNIFWFFIITMLFSLDFLWAISWFNFYEIF